MTVSLVFLALLMMGFGFWLFRQSLFVQPWVAESAGQLPALTVSRRFTAPRLGLVVFMAVVTSLFALMISAYLMRMAEAPQWELLPQPNLLWVNTGILLIGSLALQSAWEGARREHRGRLQGGLAVGALCTLAFLVGQYLVWRELLAAGYYLDTHPASAFFVIMSVLHALHLIGGLGVVALCLQRVARRTSLAQLVEWTGLCTLYWHFLYVVWLVLFGVLFVGAAPLYALCR
ncbi:cytochrome oxidase subunit III [Halomonas sp. NO4]|uniref:cytochrome c oxidase subunit 3 n=1 Tax=Halomonas sp. NO4 TaxID=2484813 RepID=UPI0013D184CC|nr:cytochrome oxidase subunit III [Halomonas sp. NO4]